MHKFTVADRTRVFCSSVEHTGYFHAAGFLCWQLSRVDSSSPISGTLNHHIMIHDESEDPYLQLRSTP